MTSDVVISHLLEFVFWALLVTAVLRNILSKDPKIHCYYTTKYLQYIYIYIVYSTKSQSIMMAPPEGHGHCVTPSHTGVF
jgi:hypothetical protein